jgi:hypothetical protein
LMPLLKARCVSSQVHEFIAACAALCVTVSRADAAAVFRAHPCDAHGGLRFVQFTDALLKGASRALSQVRAA